MQSPFVFEVIHEVTVPDEISAQGREEIIEVLNRHKITIPDDWNWRWMAKTGSFTKRLEKEAKTQNRPLPDKINALIGEIAQTHSVDPMTYYLRYTRTLDWKAGDFGDDQSCFFGGKIETFDIFRHYGVHAVQFFAKQEDESYLGLGRCFGYELEPNIHVLFNAYGRLFPGEEGTGRKDASVVRIANIVALQSGIGQYRRVNLLNDGASESGEVYVNSATGYVIGPGRLIRNISAVDLHLRNPNHVACSNCGTTGHRKEMIPGPDGPEDALWCRRCMESKYIRCGFCTSWVRRNEVGVMGGNHACKKCRSERGRSCNSCGGFELLEIMTHITDPKGWACRSCTYENVRTCARCFGRFWSHDLHNGVCRGCEQ